VSFTRPDKLSFLRFRSLRMTLLALVLLSLTLGSAGQELRVKRGEAPDQAGEDEILNRELWEFAKHTPYETALRHIYVAGKISLLNTETGSVEREQDAGYFPYSVCYSGGKVYVGLLGENKLLVYSSGLDPLKTVAVGRTPQDLCPDGDKLYAVNTGSDDISVVDLKKDTVAQTIKLTDKSGGFGRAPTSCDASADTLYVTLSGTNAVAAVDKKSGKIKGYIPAGWYPSRAILDDRQLMFLNAKGIRARRPNPKGPQPVKGKGGPEYVLTLLKGSLSVIPAAGIKDKLGVWTRQVEAGSPTSGNPSDLKPRIETCLLHNQGESHLRSGVGRPWARQRRRRAYAVRARCDAECPSPGRRICHAG